MNMMKKYLFMLAAFIAATATFTACSSEEEAVSSAEKEQGAVKAEFTISFPKQMGTFTRQGLDIIQGQSSPVFRGIQNIKLLPFSLTKEAIIAAAPSTISNPSPITLVAGTSATVGPSGYSATTSNAIANTGVLYTTSNSHLYKDISIAIGTRSFMFYGVAPDKTKPTGVYSDATYNGALTASTDGATLDKISFSPTAIYTTASNEATEIAQYLTDIATVTVGTGESAVTTLTYFPNFTSIKTGSWNSVKAAVQQVYSSLYNNTDALSEAIKTKILTKATDNAGTGNTSTGVLDFSANAYTYPANIGLPDGAASVLWDNTNKKFNVVTTDNMGLNVSPLTIYAYPASLYYFGLSNIKTMDKPMETEYNNDNSWENIVGQYTGVGSSNVVQSTTRSIAIVDKVQYGVGRLDVTVQTESSTSILKDNANQDITVGSTDFPVTGVLVGNQRAVDYKFNTQTTASVFTIYDSQMPKGESTDDPKAYLSTGSSTPSKTHTMVLETPDASSDDDSNANVTIAVEFENKSNKTIIGKDNELIYPDTKFYLIGTLKPNVNYSSTTGATYTGTTDKIRRAFVQDYITTANFKVKSFKNAYNLLPDLRTPSLEIGMSVDLTWEDGITQDITIQ